jgi:membrane-bound lytic murein transglycosylase D
MKKSLLLALLISLAHNFSLSQTPVVPDKARIGDLEFRFNDAVRKEIQEMVNELTQNSTYFTKKAARAHLYFPIVERIFREEGIPDEIKYLAIQESAFVSDAVSSSNAVGFWQFKIPAAVEVGLRVDKHVDERMNIVSSTRGAARYLKTNYSYFENWLYAILAYNTGRGGAYDHVQDKYVGAKKMQVNKRMHWYVKKFLAHMFAFQGVKYQDAEPDMLLSEYKRGNKMSLKQIAKETSTDLAVLEEYNKWLLKGHVPADKEYTVIVPLKNGKRRELLALQQQSEEGAIQSAEFIQTYPKISGEILSPAVSIVEINDLKALIASKGENLEDLAERGRIEVEDLLNYNEVGSDHEVIPGMVYYLEKKRNRSKIHFHTLKKNESLWMVSQKYGLKESKILKKNRLEGSGNLKEGLVLWLRKKRPRNYPVEYRTFADPLIRKDEAPENPSSPETISDSIPLPAGDSLALKEIPTDSLILTRDSTENSSDTTVAAIKEKLQADSLARVNLPDFHVVEPGETFFAISRKYKIQIDTLARLNNIPRNTQLNVGQKILLKPVKEAEIKSESEGAEKDIIHIVKKGETLYGIAKTYGVRVSDIMEWNKKEDYSLDLNEELLIKQTVN